MGLVHMEAMDWDWRGSSHGSSTDTTSETWSSTPDLWRGASLEQMKSPPRMGFQTAAGNHNSDNN